MFTFASTSYLSVHNMLQFTIAQHHLVEQLWVFCLLSAENTYSKSLTCYLQKRNLNFVYGTLGVSDVAYSNSQELLREW